MFQALKKLTRRLLKGFGVLLPLLFVAPAMAQWGAVTSQPDTNRFINSQQDFGLIMPHQQVIVGLLDTTITSAGTGGGNAFKVIVGSLLDHEDNCANYTIVNGVASCAGSYERWREMEKSTSWYQADRGDTTAMFPTNYAVTISTGKDSVNIWNRDTAELWMAFNNTVTNNMLRPIVGSTVSDIALKDGILYAGVETANGGLVEIDLLEARRSTYMYNGAFDNYNGDIHTRNGAQGFTAAKNMGLANRTVNGVAVVRDPFGLKDGLDRPRHWWDAITSGGVSTYNPHANLIYDSAMSGTGVWGGYTSRGSTAWIRDTAEDEIVYIRTAFDRVADSYGRDYSWSYGAVGAKALPSGENYDYGALIEGGSIVGRNSDVVVVGGSFGTYLLHQGGSIDTGEDGAKVKITSTANAPVEFGNAVLALALEDNTTDSSPYANTMTASGSPGTVTAVFGNGYSAKVGTKLVRTDADFATGTSAFTWSMWVKSASTTGAGNQVLTVISDEVQASQKVQFNSSGQLNIFWSDDGGVSDDQATTTADFYDAEWHHVLVTRDGNGTGGTCRLDVDGVTVASFTVADAAASFGGTVLTIGSQNDIGEGARFRGIIDDFMFSKNHVLPETSAHIYAEGRKKLAMGTPVFTRTPDDALISNNVVDIDALDNGMWAVAFSDANTVQVFDGRIPVQEIAAPAGTVKSVALIQSPGTDSVGVAIGTSANLKFVQPSVNLRAAMAHQYQEPIHVGTPVVVDSAGLGGIFWTGDDAVSATDNAGRSHIFVMNGTYGGVHMTKNIQRFECASPKTGTAGPGVLFDGGTTDEGIWITSAVEVSGCAFYTAPDAGGGGNSAVNMVGGSNINFHNNVVVDADATGISISASNSRITNNLISGADGNCITGGSGTSANVIADNEIRNCGSNGIQLGSGANSYAVIGNVSDQAITDDVGTSTLLNEVY